MRHRPRQRIAPIPDQGLQFGARQAAVTLGTVTAAAVLAAVGLYKLRRPLARAVVRLASRVDDAVRDA